MFTVTCDAHTNVTILTTDITVNRTQVFGINAHIQPISDLTANYLALIFLTISKAGQEIKHAEQLRMHLGHSFKRIDIRHLEVIVFIRLRQQRNYFSNSNSGPHYFSTLTLWQRRPFDALSIIPSSIYKLCWDTEGKISLFVWLVYLFVGNWLLRTRFWLISNDQIQMKRYMLIRDLWTSTLTKFIYNPY